MYVLIDMNQCAITHKHHDREVLAALSWIECLNAGITLPLGNPKLFADALTPVDMMRVYKNATGNDLKAYGNHMAGIIHEVAKRMPDSDVVPAEVYAQRKHVLPAAPFAYRYSKGSNYPEQLAELFWCIPIKVQADVVAEAAAAKAYEKFVPPPPPPPLPDVPGMPAAPVVRAPSDRPKVTRTGSVKETIFSNANRMWEEAGSPTDPTVVNDLRKRISTVLQEQFSINKSTANTQLWIWHKEKFSA